VALMPLSPSSSRRPSGLPDRRYEADHVFSHPLGLSFCPGPDPAVDIETRVPAGEKAFRPFGTQKLLADQKPKSLPSEEFSQSRVIDPGYLMEGTRLVHSALCDQEMEVVSQVDPVFCHPARIAI